MRVFQQLVRMTLLVTLFGSLFSCSEETAQTQASSELPSIAFIYEARESTGAAQMRAAADLQTSLAQVSIFTGESSGQSLTSVADVKDFDVVFLDGETPELPFSAGDIDTLKRDTRFVVVNPATDLAGNVALADHPSMELYWANRSRENDAALIAYLAQRIARNEEAFVATTPVIYPTHGFYHPAASALFNTLSDYLSWYGNRTDGHRYDTGLPTLGLSDHMIIYRQDNMAAMDAMIAEVEKQGANAIVLLRDGAVDFSHLLVDGKPIIDTLLYDGEMLDFKDREAGLAQARNLGVPLLQSLTWYKGNGDSYRVAPGGLAPELVPRVVNSERDGMLEPLVVAALDDTAATRRYLPMPEQVQWRVQRALSWAKLHRASNADKRVVFTFWSEAGGKSDVGGDPDDFLDVPSSLAALLPTMQARGYNTGTLPLPDAETLAGQMATSASNIGNWAAGELAQRASTGAVALLPEAQYRLWYDQLPAQRRSEIEAVWGPPPGKVMTTTMPDGQRYLVIPRLEFGNVLIAPHPMWGYLEDEKVLMSKDALPPHHQYLAFFLWLQREWHADAWVSLFSNLVLQPGKSEGPLADDHIGIMLGGLPHIHPERLGSNGGIGTKRKALAFAYGWYNIVAPTTSVDGSESANVPWGGKILGTAPQGEVMSSMVGGMLGQDLLQALAPLSSDPDALAARLLNSVLLDGLTPDAALQRELGSTLGVSLVDAAAAQLARAVEYKALLNMAPLEIDALFAALDGQWREPGPMGEPFRNPETLPPGRLLYNFDQRRMPTVLAEDIGRKQAEALIADYQVEHEGAYPDKITLVLFSGDIAKTNGASEAQILHLLGTRVTRNWRDEITGVELIPREELGRPRVDVLVTTSGVYRDHFQDKVELIAQAAKLAAASPEADNPVREAVATITQSLIDKGESEANARLLAAARVFSPAPGAYSPSIQFLAKSGEQRGDEQRMAELFTRRMSHAYGGGLYGSYSEATFQQNLGTMDAAVLPRSSDVNALLDNPMPAGFLGGLNLAAKQITGGETDLYVSNLQDPSQPNIAKAAAALQNELKTRYFNPAWLQENQQHGYDGARNFMLMTDHLDLWDSTATDMVSSADWAEVKAVFLDDKFDLAMDEFFDQHNPYAEQMLLTNLLGAAQRGHWQATAEELAQVAERIVESVAAHGPACEANQCRNPAMTEFIGEALATLPDAAPLLAAYVDSIAQAVTAPAATSAGAAPAPAAAPQVTGRSIEEVSLTPPKPMMDFQLQLLGLGALVLLLFGAGWWRGGRASGGKL